MVVKAINFVADDDISKLSEAEVQRLVVWHEICLNEDGAMRPCLGWTPI